MSFRAEAQALFDAMGEAYRAGDAARCAAFWTEDGAVFSPWAPPARGRAAIEALHRIWTAAPDAGRKRLTVIDAGSEGALGWCLVEFSEGDPATAGCSLGILERQPDGRWLIRLSSLNGAAEA